MKIAVICATLALAASAYAGSEEILGRFASEPTVRQLQQAATRVAELHPERVRSWMHRAGKAALMPSLRVRIGRGLGELSRDSNDRYYYTTSNDWRFDIETTWSLDRLVFERNELRASREAQRVAARREQLLTRVARLYYARRRLQVDALLSPDSPTAVERALEIDELTAELDGLTDGALSAGK
jgi:hypothetical protein